MKHLHFTGQPVYICVQMLDGQLVASTTMPKPQTGHRVTDTEAIAMSLMAAAKHLVTTVDYTPRNVPAIALAQDLRDIEMYGLAMPREVVVRAVEVLGQSAGVDIDAVHRTRQGATQ